VADLLRRVAEAGEAQRKLERTMGELQFRGQQMDSQLGQLRGEVTRLAGGEAELQRRLADATRVAEALETEIRAKQSRLAPLELSARALRQSRQAALDSMDRQMAPARTLEDLQRRREGYLGGLLGRYRELADRSGLMMSGSQLPGGAGAPDLARVQTLVRQAEEEFRQVQALDSQARLLLDRMQK
jgi:chromosome segregation ATPase